MARGMSSGLGQGREGPDRGGPGRRGPGRGGPDRGGPDRGGPGRGGPDRGGPDRGGPGRGGPGRGGPGPTHEEWEKQFAMELQQYHSAGAGRGAGTSDVGRAPNPSSRPLRSPIRGTTSQILPTSTGRRPRKRPRFENFGNIDPSQQVDQDHNRQRNLGGAASPGAGTSGVGRARSPSLSPLMRRPLMGRRDASPLPLLSTDEIARLLQSPPPSPEPEAEWSDPDLSLDQLFEYMAHSPGSQSGDPFPEIQDFEI